MRFLLAVARLLDTIISTVGRLSAWLMVILMLVIITDVTLRHWFVIGSTKLQELEWHLNGAMFLVCLGWAYSRGAHVRIELVSERLSARTRAWIELLGCLIFLLPYVAAILNFGADYLSFSWQYNESSASATGLPDRWIIKSFVLIGFALLGAAAIARICHALVFLFGQPAEVRETSFARARLAEEN